ncbi:MAG: M48 family metallopeptidase [Bacteroidota bacterium]
MTRKILSNLNPRAYEHPFDRASLDRLERTRGLKPLTQRVLDYGLERYLTIKHTGNNLRVYQERIPEIHNLLLEACRVMDMWQVPELYIELEDKIRSFTVGQKRQIIVLSSGAIDLLSDDEILFMLGRELGHIRSQHVLYGMMADQLRVITQLISDATLGIGNLLSMPLQVALMHWYRMSEFTADRAGLLVCQDPDIAARALIKVAGLPVKYHDRISVEDLKKQASAFDDIQESTFDKLIRFVAGYENSQPFTIIRASQLFKWVQSGTYEAILDGTRGELLEDEDRCPKCHYPAGKDDLFCTQCGFRLNRAQEPDFPA